MLKCPKGLKEKHIHMGMFDFSLNFVTGPHEKLVQYCAYKFEDEESDFGDVVEHAKNSHGIYCHRNGFAPFIWMPRFPKTPKEISTLAHEALHIVNIIFRWASIEMNESTEECATHALGYIVRKVLEGK